MPSYHSFLHFSTTYPTPFSLLSSLFLLLGTFRALSHCSACCFLSHFLFSHLPAFLLTYCLPFSFVSAEQLWVLLYVGFHCSIFSPPPPCHFLCCLEQMGSLLPVPCLSLPPLPCLVDSSQLVFSQHTAMSLSRHGGVTTPCLPPPFTCLPTSVSPGSLVPVWDWFFTRACLLLPTGFSHTFCLHLPTFFLPLGGGQVVECLPGQSGQEGEPRLARALHALPPALPLPPASLLPTIHTYNFLPFLSSSHLSPMLVVWNRFLLSFFLNICGTWVSRHLEHSPCCAFPHHSWFTVCSSSSVPASCLLYFPLVGGNRWGGAGSGGTPCASAMHLPPPPAPPPPPATPTLSSYCHFFCLHFAATTSYHVPCAFCAFLPLSCPSTTTFPLPYQACFLHFQPSLLACCFFAGWRQGICWFCLFTSYLPPTPIAFLPHTPHCPHPTSFCPLPCLVCPPARFFLLLPTAACMWVFGSLVGTGG